MDNDKLRAKAKDLQTQLNEIAAKTGHVYDKNKPIEAFIIDSPADLRVSDFEDGVVVG
jgi:hypothetical protein